MLHLTLLLRHRTARASLVGGACTLLVACGGLNTASGRVANIVSPYKIDVVQGNFVSKEQVAVLKAGMSRAQVRDILGTPLLVSMFHTDRWDYVFTFRRQGLEPQARKVTVFFKGDALERFDADELPTEAEFVASLDSGRRAGTVPVLEAPPDKLASFPVPAKPVDATALPPLPDKYPPLEPAGR